MIDAQTGPSRIGFVGLGAMGTPMALQLAAGPFDLMIYDLDRTAVAQVTAEGAKAAPDLGSLAEHAEVVICMLPHPDVLREVVLGEVGLIQGLRAGSVVVDMSTSGPEVVRECAELLAQRGVEMIDAPVGKGPWAAAKGELTILTGGDRAVCDRMEPILRHLGSEVHYCGPLGSGQVLKLANNLVACANMAALTEAYSLAVREGADPAILTAMMPHTSADSWQLRHTLIEKVLAGDLTPMFKLGLAAKDMRLVTALGEKAGSRLDCARSTQALYDEAEARGLGDFDWGAVLLVDHPELAPDQRS